MELPSPGIEDLDAINDEEFPMDQSRNEINFFACPERTLQTPLLPRSYQTYGDDPILSWVNSLPMPSIPIEDFVDDFGDSAGDGYDLLEDSIGISDGKVTSVDENQSEIFPYTPKNQTPLPKEGNGDCSGVSDNSTLAIQSKDIEPTSEPLQANVVINLTESENEKENNGENRESSKTNAENKDRKRCLDTHSPELMPCKRVALQSDSNRDVIEIGEDFPHNERASSVGSFCSATSDFMLSPSATLPNPRMLRDIVQRYLKRNDEMKIIIHHAKVVQKSYGSEKRFFCPPPCVRLVGNGWKTKKRRKNVSASSTSSPMPSPLNSPASGNVTKASDVCAFIGVVGGDEMQQLRLDTTKGYAAAKSLHIPDSDKRKHFELNVKMFYGDGSEIGRFLSKRIKVISKPSKKPQSVKNPELCIASGTRVSFFNRIRSQTVSTRYLHATRDGFCASSTEWGSFHIYLTKNDCEDNSRFDVLDGYIHYGNSVKVVCALSGISLPKLVIRKLDKNDAVIDTDEPVAQFHKCAMFLQNSQEQYLCLSQDKVIAYTAASSGSEACKLNSGSCWTIISTEKAEYCWSDSSLQLSNTIGVTPVPVVHSLQINGGGQMAMIELIGENFTPNLTIWFSTVQANTMYRCEESLICVVPEIKKIKPDWKFVKDPVKVTLVLTRDDGLLYPTHINFFYMPEPTEGRPPNPTIREILKRNQFY